MNLVRILIVLCSTSLPIFMSCSSSSTPDLKKMREDSLTEKIVNSVEAFQNRPTHKILTEKIIDTIPDDNLVQAVFDNLLEKLGTDFNKEYEIVNSWNKSRQAIYLIWLLEAEVNNGGFNQFYANSSGQFYKQLPGALKLIGAEKFANLTERANKVYEKENKKITQHQDGTVEGFSKSYDNNPLNKFDDEFYKLYDPENLQQLQVNFIRKNKSDFVDK